MIFFKDRKGVEHGFNLDHLIFLSKADDNCTKIKCLADTLASFDVDFAVIKGAIRAAESTAVPTKPRPKSEVTGRDYQKFVDERCELGKGFKVDAFNLHIAFRIWAKLELPGVDLDNTLLTSLDKWLIYEVGVQVSYMQENHDLTFLGIRLVDKQPTT
jgi:hypothetical protein